MNYTINVRGRLLSLAHPQVMGILNVTPDSFYCGSRKQTEREIADRANEIIAQGGTIIDVGAFSTRPYLYRRRAAQRDIIDVGAFSTRPGAQEVSEEEEARRLKWALGIVRREQPDAPVSVDTYRPLVARQCIEDWGADIINDVSEGGLTGIVNTPIHETGSMFEVVGQLRVPYILMSVKPDITSMMQAFSREVQQLRDLGARDIILDPGYGFGKTLEQNYAVLRDADKLLALDLPVLTGVSRKSMIFKLVGGDPTTSLNGTTAIHAIALMKGSSILRVHDVKEAVECVKIYDEMLSVE